MKGIIYKATNKINNKSYIGQTIKELHRRRYKHEIDAISCMSNYPFHRAIRKYGKDNFEWDVLCVTDSKEKLDLLEKFYIASYKTFKKLYNLTNGGDGISGLRHTEETKKKMAEKRTGTTHSIESRRKIGEASIGRPAWNKGIKGVFHHTKETKIKMSKSKTGKPSPHKGHKLSEENRIKLRNANIGKKHSEETKRKLSESHKGRIPWNKGLSKKRDMQ